MVPRNNPSVGDQFEKDLKGLKSEMIGETQTAFSELFSSRLRSSEAGQRAVNEIMNKFSSNIVDIAKRIQEVRDLQERQTGELDQLALKKLLDKTRIVMATQREIVLLHADVLHSSIAAGQITTERQILDVVSRIGSELENQDIDRLLFKAGIDVDDLGKSMEELAPDWTGVIERVVDGDLEEEDWQDIEGAVLAVQKPGAGRKEKHLAITLCNYLKASGAEQEFLQRMMDQDNASDIALMMVASAYIDQNEAENVLLDEIALLKDELGSLGPLQRKQRKGLEARIAKLQNTIREIHSEVMQKRIERAAWVEEHVTERLRTRVYGSKRFIPKIISAKGVVGVYAGISLASSFFINFLMDPKGFFKNPGTIATGVASAGLLEWMDGFGGLLPKPSDVKNLMRDKGTERAEKVEDQLDRLKLWSQGASGRIYLRSGVAEKAIDAYKRERTRTGNRHVSIHLEDLGINYADLPAEDRTRSKESIEQNISQMTEDLFHRVGESGTNHRAFLDKLLHQ